MLPLAAGRRAFVALLLGLAGALPCAAIAQEDAAVLERRVKGALLYRFIAYVEWPESAFAGPDSPFVIGILGNDALATELQAFVAGRTAGKRPITVRRLRASDSVKDLHMLFIGASETHQLERAVRGTGATLIVTESPGALQQGSVIDFTIVNEQVRFSISLDSARQRNLRMSSRLLSVAQDVRPVTP
jgi:hypothetical protein